MGPGGTVRFGTRIFPKVLYEIEGSHSHNALHCLLRSVVYLPVLHLIVDSEENLLQPLT